MNSSGTSREIGEDGLDRAEGILPRTQLGVDSVISSSFVTVVVFRSVREDDDTSLDRSLAARSDVVSDDGDFEGRFRIFGGEQSRKFVVSDVRVRVLVRVILVRRHRRTTSGTFVRRRRRSRGRRGRSRTPTARTKQVRKFPSLLLLLHVESSERNRSVSLLEPLRRHRDVFLARDLKLGDRRVGIVLREVGEEDDVRNDVTSDNVLENLLGEGEGEVETD
jgi:hypothetical protein